ncbi:hypothetical protein LPJ66_000423 [Kickxella alabastrina]|uniref:Uncharacterized protein n=1 Tax=Kickxella alabastrina TaxID=61397 RepID=A0ACC1IW57_9FUNG|nr:hypothetical protein LPJ66_000423 [Kickxella alabastrina]
MIPANPTIENLTPEVVAKTIDHALLRPDLTTQQVIDGCKLSADYQVASVCVRPCDVSLAASHLQNTGVDIGTVVGFPHGTTSTAAKVAESLQALADGATELDMVLNIGYAKSGQWNKVQEDIRAVVAAAKGRYAGCCVKVIFECCLLAEEEIRKACWVCEEAGADFVKTSTGFSTGGARIEDLKVMRGCTSVARTGVKASGGIRSLEDLVACLQAGAARIGTSATADIINDLRARQK